VRHTIQHVVVRRSHHMPSWLRWSRYMVGSVICFFISELVLVVLFATHLLGAKGASVVASVAAIVPGYYLNRSWTWGRTRRSDFWREVVPYGVSVVVSIVVAALATGAANAAFINQPRSTRTVINAAAFVAAYGVLFVVKYFVYHKVLFKPTPITEAARAEAEASSTSVSASAS
jgi:putative flippase GtrA